MRPPNCCSHLLSCVMKDRSICWTSLPVSCPRWLRIGQRFWLCIHGRQHTSELLYLAYQGIRTIRESLTDCINIMRVSYTDDTLIIHFYFGWYIICKYKEEICATIVSYRSYPIVISGSRPYQYLQYPFVVSSTHRVTFSMHTFLVMKTWSSQSNVHHHSTFDSHCLKPIGQWLQSVYLIT